MTVRLYTSRSQQTTLTSAVTSGGTTINVANASILFATVPAASITGGATFTIVLDPDTALEEIVEVTSASSNTLTITRSVDAVGTATDHSAGAVVRHMVIGRDLREANTHIEATGQVHGLAATGGVVVGTSQTQTLTNKTLTTPTIAGATLSGTITSTATISGGTLTGAIVTGLTSSGMADTQATPKNYVDAILGSAVAASTSAASAATSASSAATSASSAATSASSAATSRSSSLTSQTAAATSASSAATSATSSANSATAASTSASSAATSATSAAASATAAASSATTAANSVATIQTSATSAANSATAAATSASSAATSASSAATSASSAAASTSAAATSASSAAVSATAAATSASSAATSATSSANSATASASSATAAATSAASAATSQTAAATSASSAATSQSAAATSASSAATSATSAATSATSSASSATLASQWATKMDGTVDGSDYSAKYWAFNANPSSNINTSAYTNKGVILVGTGVGTYTQLTVASTNGYVLNVDSSTTSGVSWVAPNPGDITSVTAGTGLTGGGTGGDVTLSLATTAVSSGSYTYSSITVDAYGRITSASNGSTSGFATTTSVTDLTTLEYNNTILALMGAY